MKIRFKGIKPNRKHYDDGGADLKSYRRVFIASGETRAIDINLKLDLPNGTMGLILPRSGLASKGITVQSPPIDAGYKGDIKVIVTNLSDCGYTIEEGERIAQLVVMPIYLPDFVDGELDERCSNGFGSTGRF